MFVSLYRDKELCVFMKYHIFLLNFSFIFYDVLSFIFNKICFLVGSLKTFQFEEETKDLLILFFTLICVYFEKMIIYVSDGKIEFFT